MPNAQNITEVTGENVFYEMTGVYQEAAAKAMSSIMRTQITVTQPEASHIELKNVEYMLLEPAIFVKSCLTSQVAGTELLIFRQRDIQIFLNKLMGIDELASPDFVFDEISLSAANEIMNQMVHSATEAMAAYLGNTMKSSDCVLTTSEDIQGLPEVMGEDPDSTVMVISHKMNIDGMIDSEFLQVVSAEAQESIQEEIKAKKEQLIKDAQEEQKMKEKAESIRNVPMGDINVAGTGGFAGTKVNFQKGAGTQDSVIQDIPYKSNLGLIMNVPLNVTVEIGRAKRKLKEVLSFDSGTVVELEKQADAPVDIIVNGQLIARGNVVVIDDNFGVRVTEIVNKTNIFGNGE
ncbi:flagellar motor switch protein FliN [Faecalicatena sp. AGMB00832]|uniref:Flagellar motor switch protein FliN n=1 Tax=Faecalicatena faecalis TaxID=2726362 RepID=A0ABS6DAB4_9FIRM|nr:flagellar motor switch protein FliN [Faecalicatena faecalis]MBU3878155.1 flagellar motor switch protein FliN [Faecalicatena faecalis]